MTKIKNKTKVGFLVMAIMLLGLPGLTQAATYGYVGNDGFVRSVIANNWQEAIDIASRISIHSGVILFQNTGDSNIVGNYVSVI